MNNKFYGAALALSLSACAKAPVVPNKCDLPKHLVEVAPPAATTPNPIAAKPKYDPPLTAKDFVGNFLSCEANAAAESAYIDVLQRRFKVTEIPASALPCNIIQDIHAHLSLVVDSCSQVKVPVYFDVDNEEMIRQFSAMMRVAKEAALAATKTRDQLETSEKRCFNKITFDL